MTGVKANNFLVLQFVSKSHIWVVDVICTLSNYITLWTFFFFFNTNHNFQIGGVVAGKLVCVVVAYGDFWFFPMLVGK